MYCRTTLFTNFLRRPWVISGEHLLPYTTQLRSGPTPNYSSKAPPYQSTRTLIINILIVYYVIVNQCLLCIYQKVWRESESFVMSNLIIKVCLMKVLICCRTSYECNGERYTVAYYKEETTLLLLVFKEAQ